MWFELWKCRFKAAWWALISQMLLRLASCQPGTGTKDFWIPSPIQLSLVKAACWKTVGSSHFFSEPSLIWQHFCSIHGLRLYARSPGPKGRILDFVFFCSESRLIALNSYSQWTEKRCFEIYAFVGLYSFVHVTNYKVISIISIHLNTDKKGKTTIYYSDKGNQHFLIIKLRVILFSCTSV